MVCKGYAYDAPIVYTSHCNIADIDIHTGCMFVNKQTINSSSYTTSLLLHLRLITLQYVACETRIN